MFIVSDILIILFWLVFVNCKLFVCTLQSMFWQEKIRSVEMTQLEKTQGKRLKRIFQLPVWITYTGIIMEIGIWPTRQKIQYATEALSQHKT